MLVAGRVDDAEIAAIATDKDISMLLKRRGEGLAAARRSAKAPSPLP